MSKVVLWFGPVATSQVAKATLPDVDHFIVVGGGCPPGQGDPSCQGSNYFSMLAETWFDGKRYLPKLLRLKGIDPASEPEVYIGSFSAGHGAVKKLCMSPDDRRLIQAVVLADSTYCAWPNHVAQYAEGYVRACVDAVKGPRLFVATASSNTDPAGNTPAGDVCMVAIRDEVEKRTGAKFRPSPNWPSGIAPQPVAVWQAGNCILADYGSRVSHENHARHLAAQVWQQLVVPWTIAPQTCFTVAAAAQGTQGVGDDWTPPAGTPSLCTMWGRWPPGSTIPQAPSDVGAGSKMAAFGLGGALAYAGFELGRRWLERG